MKMQSVAVIVPCYNAESTLAVTLDSVVGQDHVSDIVVIDDGSRDDTLAIARKFEPRVRVFTGPNGGVSSARNRGIAETSTDWLLFLDSDDLLMPGTIMARMETAEETKADVVICDWEDMVDDGAGTVKVGARRIVDWSALKANPEVAAATHVWATTAAILYSRSIVKIIGGFRRDLPVIQDARFLFDAAYHKAQFAHAPHIGARYRIVPGSLSRRNPARFWEDVLVNGQHIESLWRQANALDDERRKAVFGIYNHAARGLFSAESPRYFDAVNSLRGLGLGLTRHGRIATPLAHIFGLPRARSMLAVVQGS